MYRTAFVFSLKDRHSPRPFFQRSSLCGKHAMEGGGDRSLCSTNVLSRNEPAFCVYTTTTPCTLALHASQLQTKKETMPTTHPLCRGFQFTRLPPPTPRCSGIKSRLPLVALLGKFVCWVQFLSEQTFLRPAGSRVTFLMISSAMRPRGNVSRSEVCCSMQWKCVMQPTVRHKC